MTNHNTFEDMIRDCFRTRHVAACTTSELDKKVLDSAFAMQRQIQQQRSALTDPNVRRFLMHHRKTELAAAAVVILAVVLGVSLFHNSASPAYAVGQTLDAMKRIETVYMKGEFYKYRELKCSKMCRRNPGRLTLKVTCNSHYLLIFSLGITFCWHAKNTNVVLSL